MAKEQIKQGTRRKIEGRDHVWNGKKWTESMGFWRKQKTKTVGGQDYRLVDGKWVKSHGASPRVGPAIGGAIKGVLGLPTRKQEAEAKKLRERRQAKERESKKKDNLRVNTSETKPTKPSTTKPNPTKPSTTKPKPKKQQDDGGKAAWLKKSRNSPAAQSGAFTDDERWALQQKHRKWKADRAAGKLKKKKFDPRKGKNQRR